MATVKELLDERVELRQLDHVWSSVREYLESFLPEGSEGAELKVEGVAVPDDILISVINQIETDCLDPIRIRMQAIEGSKVQDAEQKASKAKPAKRNGKAKPRSKRRGSEKS